MPFLLVFKKLSKAFCVPLRTLNLQNIYERLLLIVASFMSILIIFFFLTGQDALPNSIKIDTYRVKSTFQINGGNKRYSYQNHGHKLFLLGGAVVQINQALFYVRFFCVQQTKIENVFSFCPSHLCPVEKENLVYNYKKPEMLSMIAILKFWMRIDRFKKNKLALKKIFNVIIY